MKNLLIILSILLFTGLAAAQQPALIDREVFFGNPEYAGAQISPDGKYISFMKPLKDVRNVGSRKRTLRSHPLNLSQTIPPGLCGVISGRATVNTCFLFRTKAATKILTFTR